MQLYRRVKLSKITVEVILLLVITAAFVIEMAHIADTAWLQVFLHDSDSLTLPIIYKSLQLHEPLEWVFSAQLNLFPEAIIFAVAAVFTRTVESALAVNAFINVLVFYGLVRVILRVIASKSLAKRQTYGLLTVLVLLGFMLLETPTTFGQALVTYMLFSSYYSGPLFIGLLNVGVLAYLIKHPLPLFSRKRWLALAGLGLINSSTVASNPMFVIQFTAPLLATLALLWQQKILKGRQFLQLVALQLAPVAVGMLVRQTILKGYIGLGLGTFLAPVSQIFEWRPLLALSIKTIAPIAASSALRLRMFLSTILYFSTVFILLFSLRKSIKRFRPEVLFVLLFIVLEPLVLLLCLYDSTVSAERYMIAPFIIGVIAISLIAVTSFSDRYVSQIKIGLISLSLIILMISPLQFHKLTAFQNSYVANETCLDEALEGKPEAGLADYWVSRALDVYNSRDQRVLQMWHNESPAIYPWLNNVGAYRDKQFSFYILQRKHRLTPLFNREVTDPPANYTSVSACENFLVYHYAPGSQGYNDLNKSIQNSLKRVQKARKAGTLGDENAY